MDSGVIISMAKTYGFIRSLHPVDTFFHIKDLEKGDADYIIKDGELNVGLMVQFVRELAEGGRMVARHIRRAEEGSVVLETTSKEQFIGYVVMAPDPGQMGYIRYIPGQGKVAHLPFFETEVVDRSSQGPPTLQGPPPLQGSPNLHGSIVLFNICTDKRKEAMAEKGGDKEKHHAANRAVKIIPGIDLDSDAMNFLEPSMRANIAILKMMGDAFPGL